MTPVVISAHVWFDPPTICTTPVLKFVTRFGVAVLVVVPSPS
jgi:hypothetical protein